MTGAGGVRSSATSALLLLALVGYAVLIHHGVGPFFPESGGAWWAPRGFLHRAWTGSRLDGQGRPVALLVAPAALLCAVVLATRRSAPARTLALAASLAVALFGFYGFGRARLVWRLFHWRASAVMVLLALTVAAAALAPLWVQAATRRSRVLVGLGYAGVAALIVVLERSVTGTDPSLPFAVSPWPVIPVFGLETAAFGLAAVFGGSAVSLAGVALLGPSRRRSLRALGVLFAASGPALPPLAVWAGSAAGALPFRAGGRTLVGAAVVAALLASAAILHAGRGALRRRARLLAASAVAMGLPVLAGQLLARWDYEVTRDLQARRIIDALAAYQSRQGTYPESLHDLVASSDLERVPTPRIGFGLLGRGEFTYQEFGTSYLLEFSAPRWVQCAYNPPYEDEAGGSDERLAGAWSCPADPPELW